MEDLASKLKTSNLNDNHRSPLQLRRGRTVKRSVTTTSKFQSSSQLTTISNTTITNINNVITEIIDS